MQTSPRPSSRHHEMICFVKGRVRENTYVPPSESVAEGENELHLRPSPRGNASLPVHPSLSDITLGRGASRAQWIPHAYDSWNLKWSTRLLVSTPKQKRVIKKRASRITYLVLA